MKDQELDDLDKGLRPKTTANPFIERPDERQVQTGSLCWLDGTRVCGADCTAFNPEEISERGLESDSPNKCLALLYLGQSAAGALATIASSRAAQRRSQDRVREQNGGNPPVPEVK